MAFKMKGSPMKRNFGLNKTSPLEQKTTTTDKDGNTTTTRKRIFGGEKTVVRDESGKKTRVTKTRKADKEGNVKYKTKQIHRGTGGRKIVHKSKSKMNPETGRDVEPSKESVRRNYGPKKGTTRYTEDWT